MKGSTRRLVIHFNIDRTIQMTDPDAGLTDPRLLIADVVTRLAWGSVGEKDDGTRVW
jgi:hypothetical protein